MPENIPGDDESGANPQRPLLPRAVARFIFWLLFGTAVLAPLGTIYIMSTCDSWIERHSFNLFRVTFNLFSVTCAAIVMLCV